MLDEIGTPDRIPLFLARAKDKSDPFRLMGFGHRVYKNFDPRMCPAIKTCAVGQCAANPCSLPAFDPSRALLGAGAKLMQGIAERVLATVESTPQLELARQLEAAARRDEYFVKRKLYPNGARSLPTLRSHATHVKPLVRAANGVLLLCSTIITPIFGCVYAVDFYSGIVLRAIGIPVSMFTVMFAVARSVGWLAQWNESFADAQQRISRPRQLYVGVPMRDFVEKDARGE